MISLAIIIVSWNTRDLLRRCLRSLETSLAATTIDYRIVVVDNASHDGTPQMLRAEFPRIQLIAASRNLGFAAGNNAALHALGVLAPAAVPPPDYCLLLNPDTEVQPAALPHMLAYLEAHPDLIAVGPQLRYADGALQSSRRRFPTPATFFWESTALERCWPANPWARRYHCADRPAGRLQPVDWLVGAALLVRSSAIRQAGPLDEGFFMYSEEMEWQIRLQAVGKPEGSRIVYLPQAVVVHYEGRSSEQVPAARHVYFQRSKLRFARMRYGLLFALLLRLFLLLTYLWELALECAKLVLRHRPDLRRRRIAVYAVVLQQLALISKQRS
jgi:N-acetylglucosaminyl-diphospho-decaprenol L-rhamnosyltransferase